MQRHGDRRTLDFGRQRLYEFRIQRRVGESEFLHGAVDAVVPTRLTGLVKKAHAQEFPPPSVMFGDPSW